VNRYGLKFGQEAKKTSTHYEKFFKKYGALSFELEALNPADLQKELQATIDSVINVSRFNEELNQEKADSVKIESVRMNIRKILAGVAI